MRAVTNLITTGGMTVALALGGCGKAKQDDARDAAPARATAKRQQMACASSAAYDRLKGLLFDQAIAAHDGLKANLDSLADYSVVRMEEPVVVASDPELDLTRCKGRFILELPPGAERAFGGERRLRANIDYTAQAAADGNGLVYRLAGAEPIVERLATFNLTSVAYRPPPAIDEREGGSEGPEPATIVQGGERSELPADDVAPEPRSRSVTDERGATREVASENSGGEATVRAFYDALGAGDGRAASSRIVPEKRSGRAFTADGMSRFYGGLAEPIRLTAIEPISGGAYRVRYRYSAGRSRCEGSAVVRLTNRAGDIFIRSIEALNGC